MIFHSLTYLVFLAVVLTLYWALPRRGQNILVLVASYMFYGWEHPWFLLPLWASTIVDYSCARGMERFPNRRRWFLIGSVAASIALLSTFKYAGFFIENLNAVLMSFGSEPCAPQCDWSCRRVCPFILFNLSDTSSTFTAVECAPSATFSITRFTFHFFRSSSRVRSNALRTCCRNIAACVFSMPAQWRAGFGLMLWGFFKKVVIADNVAVVANKVFALTDPTFPVVWAGVFAFAVQIYADFSGYTDIARGTARLMGIDLMKNFNHPYLASSPADFWRRWHISLSTWMRDFIYIPLGGNRCSVARASFNLMATFTISGLWHGASWNYVLVGGVLGFADFGAAFSWRLGVVRRIPWFAKVAITFAANVCGLVAFPRAQSSPDRARSRAVAVRCAD